MYIGIPYLLEDKIASLNGTPDCTGDNLDNTKGVSILLELELEAKDPAITKEEGLETWLITAIIEDTSTGGSTDRLSTFLEGEVFSIASTKTTGVVLTWASFLSNQGYSSDASLTWADTKLSCLTLDAKRVAV